MPESPDSLSEQLRDILRRLVALGKSIHRQWLGPALGFIWHSTVDLVLLVNTPQNRKTLVIDPLMRVERRLEALLPESWRHQRPLKTTGLILVLLLLLIGLTGDHSVEDLQESGELVVITRESRTILYEEEGRPAGPEYDYLKSFTEFLGVELRIDFRESSREVLEAIKGDEGHLAAAGMTYYPPLEDEGYVFGPGFQAVDVQVVCRRGNRVRPRDIDDLEEVELVVVADSIYESRLFELQREHPGLTWESAEDTNVDRLLELVWRKDIDCTVANSSELNIKRRFYPELQVAFTIEEDQTLAWTLSPEWEALSDSIEQWLELIRKDGTLLILRDRHYAEEEFDYVDMRTFIRRIKSRLPKLEPMFRRAAEEHGLPWTLLAAQAYQESHWNRRAKSPTGVRGIMMLTLTTAKEMGVDSRLDPEQSIRGGAGYLRGLEKRIPDSVTGDDRWWFALAAYNMGMGHLYDARELARELDLDPDSWLELKGVLPLLAQKQYYKNLKYGFARGTEPVTYVRQIRRYQNILHAQIARQRGIHAEDRSR